MITARVDTGTAEVFVRNQVRVVASYQDGRQQVIIGRSPDGHEYTYVIDGSDPPEGGSLFVLDTRRDVAHAVYLALKEHFEPKDPVPLASDRAYADARQDIERQQGLIEKLIDVCARPPLITHPDLILTTTPSP